MTGWIKYVRGYGIVAIAIVMLSACASQPNPNNEPIIDRLEPPPVPVLPIIPPEIVSAFNADVLYKLLVAEISGQRDQLGVAIQNYLDVAHATHDLDVIRRATHVALYAKDDDKTRELAQLWVAVDYGDIDPHKILAKLAYEADDFISALEHLDVVLDSDDLRLNLEQKLWVMVDVFNLKDHSAQAKTLLQQLMAEYQNDADALFTYAKVLIYLQALPEALATLEQALRLSSENRDIAMRYVALLNKMGRADEGLAWLEKALQKNAEDFELRIFHARILADLNSFAKAKKQFEILLQQKPNDPNVLLSLGLLYMHSEDMIAAEATFLQLAMITNYKDDAQYYLGRIAETNADFLVALELYQKVTGGNHHFSAQTRIAILLSKQNKLEEARAYLHRVLVSNQQQQYFLIQTEAEILVNAKKYKAAMDVYDEALQGKYNTELLYARAMLAEKIGRLDRVEQDLRAILLQEPNNAQVLNALGYTLADKTYRYDEAYAFIALALSINAHDYHILDSMGWVLYRQGKLDQAIMYLNKAWMRKPHDPEISAHLGEVLWMKGEEKAARATWDAAIEKMPNDKKLRQVIEKFY